MYVSTIPRGTFFWEGGSSEDREFREFREIREISEISEISEIREFRELLKFLKFSKLLIPAPFPVPCPISRSFTPPSFDLHN